MDNFQWASNLVILQSFTTKLKFYYYTELGLIKYVDLKVKRHQEMPIIMLGGPQIFYLK